MENKIYLFAYGSMKKGFKNHFRLENDNFIGQAKTKKQYCMYPSPSFMYPYGKENEHVWQLQGKLYELTSTDIKTIDDFEGVPKYYYRKRIEVLCNKQTFKAFIYFMENENPNNYEKDIPLKEWTLYWQEVGLKQTEYLEAYRIALDKNFQIK